MKINKNHRLSKLTSTREPIKIQQIRIPQLGVTFKSRRKTNGRDITVYCQLTYPGNEPTRFSTNITCKRKDFDVKSLTINGQPEASALLATLKANAIKAVFQLRTFGQPIDLETIKKLTLGNTLNSNQIPTLTEGSVLFLERSKKEQKTGTIDRDTYKQHERWAKRVGEYFTAKYGKKCAFSDVKPSDAKDLQLALRLESKHGQNYSLKIVQFVKRILNYAVENLWIERNPFMNFRGNRKPGPIEYLNEKELELLANTTKLNPSLKRVLDVFCFQCVTGFCWSDVEQLTRNDIGTHEETGVRFIEKPRQKSGTPQLVPLIPQAEQLLAKYANDPICKANGRLLPVPANATMNNYLKEIAAVVGIQKRLTTHMSRRTFITLFYERGMSLKSVSIMAGHRHVSVTESHYLRITPGKIIKEMQSVFPEMQKSSTNQANEAA